MTSGDEFLRSLLDEDSTLIDEEAMTGSIAASSPGDESDPLGIEEMLRGIERTNNLIHEARSEAEHEQFRSSSDDQGVTAIVNGVGNLIDLEIQDFELRQAHLSELGPKIVRVIGVARGQAQAKVSERMQQILPDF